MTNRTPKDPAHAARREELLAGERARLRELHIKARQGHRLPDPQHLQAALAFGRLYREATGRKRKRREDFEDRLREELRAEGLEREHPQVQKWKLPASITRIDDAVRRAYLRKPYPQRSLRHYLAGVRVAADLLDRDLEAAEIAFLRDLPVWREGPRLDVPEEVWDAADALCDALAALGRGLAHDLGLMDTFRRLNFRSVRWLPFEERLEPCDGLWMDGPFSPVHPVADFGTHLSEMRPFPSVPLVRIPMGWVEGELLVEAGPGAAAEHFGGPRAPGEMRPRPGRLVQFREVRLALAPLDGRQAGCVLLSQDALGWRDAGPHGHGALRWIVGEGNWAALREDVGSIPRPDPDWRHEMPLADGWHRVLLRCGPNLDHASPAYALQDDWEWDPVEHPGSFEHPGRGYVGATRLTPGHVHLWLLRSHEVEGEGVDCPWDDAAFEAGGRGMHLRSPLLTPARSIEACLHGGQFVRALRERAEAVAQQVEALVEEGRREALAAHDALLARLERGGA